MRTSSTSARYPLGLRHARIFLWMDATPWPSNSGCFSLNCRDISLKVRELLVTRSAAPQVRHVVPYRGGLLASAIALKLSAYVQSMFRDEGTGHLFTTMAYTFISLSLSLFATSPNL